jgi:hypothetical protein
MLHDARQLEHALALACVGVEEFGKAFLYTLAALRPDQRDKITDKISGHHTKRWVFTQVMKNVDELRLLAEPVDQRIRKRTIARAGEVTQSAHLRHEWLGELLHASQHHALASGIDRRTPGLVLDQLEALLECPK